MFRIAALAASLLLANVSFAGDLLPIVFEESTITMGGCDVKCDLYYILIGDNGSLERGDLVQISQLHNDREHYGITKGRFSANDEIDRITIHWPASEGQKFGKVEKARLNVTDTEALRITYEIYQHDDASQVGHKLRARVVDYNQLPAWVRSAVTPRIIAKLPPEQQVQYHRMQAAQIRAASEIINAYLD